MYILQETNMFWWFGLSLSCQTSMAWILVEIRIELDLLDIWLKKHWAIRTIVLSDFKLSRCYGVWFGSYVGLSRRKLLWCLEGEDSMWILWIWLNWTGLIRHLTKKTLSYQKNCVIWFQCIKILWYLVWQLCGDTFEGEDAIWLPLRHECYSLMFLLSLNSHLSFFQITLD